MFTCSSLLPPHNRLLGVDYWVSSVFIVIVVLDRTSTMAYELHLGREWSGEREKGGYDE